MPLSPAELGLWTGLGLLFSAMFSVSSSQAQPVTDGSLGPAPRIPSGAPLMSPEHVCCVFETQLLRNNHRTTVVVMDDGRQIETSKPLEAFAATNWPCLHLADAGRVQRRILVQASKIEVIRSAEFRRSDRLEKDTVLVMAGGRHFVVDGPLDQVRHFLGI